jgi:flagellar biosynthesis protein
MSGPPDPKLPSESDPRVKPPSSFTTAVAIEYDRATDDAPRVTASGKGAIAEQILAIAFERGIKVREDADLVEILSLVEVDSPIPLEAFATVAEILALVYQANAQKKPRPPAWKNA